MIEAISIENPIDPLDPKIMDKDLSHTKTFPYWRTYSGFLQLEPLSKTTYLAVLGSIGVWFL